MRADDVIGIPFRRDGLDIDLLARPDQGDGLDHPQRPGLSRQFNRLHLVRFVGPDETETIRNARDAAQILILRDLALERPSAVHLDSGPLPRPRRSPLRRPLGFAAGRARHQEEQKEVPQNDSSGWDRTTCSVHFLALGYHARCECTLRTGLWQEMFSDRDFRRAAGIRWRISRVPVRVAAANGVLGVCRWLPRMRRTIGKRALAAVTRSRIALFSFRAPSALALPGIVATVFRPHPTSGALAVRLRGSGASLRRRNPKNPSRGRSRHTGFCGQCGGPLAAIVADQQHLGPRRGRIADGLDAVERHIGQQADPHGAGRPDVVAECAGQQDPVNVRVSQTEFVHEDADARQDRGLGKLHLADIPLRKNQAGRGGFAIGGQAEGRLALALAQS